VNGSSSPAAYDGSQFAKRGVVMVSFHYGTGRFGFFSLIWRGLPQRTAYSIKTDTLMDFSATGPVAKCDPWKDRLDLTGRLATQK
jgi:hypothetical protein